MIIAIDGPAGSGKSTVARRLAQELGFQYIDTGAMYRALTDYFLNEKITAETEIIPRLADLDMQLIPGGIELNGTKLTHELRTERIDEHVSYYSGLKSIRDWAVDCQRKFGGQANVVLDGRDIGTVVFPKADHKFYLEADPRIRAKRRALERGEMAHFDEILLDLIRRDQLDSSREHSPLKRADDAIVIDTSGLTIDQVVAVMKEYVDETLSSNPV